jgi:diphosphoinositol-polyphosphate diphosphatase
LDNTPTAQLAQRCFPSNNTAHKHYALAKDSSTVVTDMASIATTASDSSSNYSSNTAGNNSSGNHHHQNKAATPQTSPTKFLSLPSLSRQGRDQQRWEGDVRLVTGCVPITTGGGVLLCSSSKKREWIIPKGGWEIDETVEEAAVRESFEECGVVGTLGQRLSDVVYKARKSKKVAVTAEAYSAETTTNSSGNGNHSDAIINRPLADANSDNSDNVTDLDNSSELMQDQPSGSSSSSSSGGSSTPGSTERVCKSFIFPLYVTEVLHEWPEDNRARCIMSIDDAIEAVSRPELKRAIEEVKARGLHLVVPGSGAPA